MNVVIFRNLPPGSLHQLQREFPEDTFQHTTDRAQLEEWLGSAEVIFGNPPAECVPRAPRLRWLQIHSSGIDEYLSLRDSSVIITTAHGIHARVIAQHVAMTVLWFARGMAFFQQAQVAHSWRREPGVPRPFEAQTIGLIGGGAIGREVARLMAALGFQILVTKKTPPQNGESLGGDFMPWSQLDELLALSDHVVIALPLTAETAGLFDRSRLARFKEGAVLHNIARGGIVDETPLLDALQTGRLGGAALDVFDHEPLPADSPFWTLPNVLVTPHIAGHHQQLPSLLVDRFRENFHRFRQGQTPAPAANFARGY